MNEKRISANQANAIFQALADANLWAVCAIEFPDMVEVVTRSMERPTKRTVAISRDGVTTIFDAAWLDIMRTQDDGSMYGNNTQG